MLDQNLVFALANSILLAAGVYFMTRPSKKKTEALKGCKFYYFPVAARGDAHRLALTIAKVKFTNHKVFPMSAWADMKPLAPWNSLPYLELANGTVLGQSRAVLRFIGKGCSMYPTDALLAARVDECLDGVDDMNATANKTGQGLSGDEKLAKRGEACKEGGDIYNACRRVEACYERAGTAGPYLTGELTIADLTVFAQVGWCVSGFFDGVSAELLKPFPRLQAVRQAVFALPEVAAYYKAEKGETYMEAVVGGNKLGDCYERMLSSSSA